MITVQRWDDDKECWQDDLNFPSLQAAKKFIKELCEDGDSSLNYRIIKIIEDP